jgi:hypothetical protein
MGKLTDFSVKQIKKDIKHIKANIYFDKIILKAAKRKLKDARKAASTKPK